MGRALYIAVNFEDKCKYLLQAAGMAEATRDDPVATLDDLLSRAPTSRPLFGTLQALERLVAVSETDAATLSAARAGRNFIAHKGALFSIHEHPGPSVREAIAGNRTYDLEHLKGHLVALRRNVQEVARGDNIVSTWCFDFAERGKVSRPDVLIKEYEVMVERWVLDPVADLLADDGS